MQRRSALALLLASFFLACPDKAPMPGADRDAHGCLGSGGYQWCQKEGRCVRSWELATERHLDPTPEAFAAYCGR